MHPPLLSPCFRFIVCNGIVATAARHLNVRLALNNKTRYGNDAGTTQQWLEPKWLRTHDHCVNHGRSDGRSDGLTDNRSEHVNGRSDGLGNGRGWSFFELLPNRNNIEPSVTDTGEQGRPLKRLLNKLFKGPDSIYCVNGGGQSFLLSALVQ